MISARRPLLFALIGMLALLPAMAQAQLRWTQGKQYQLLQPPGPVSAPAGKIQVTEVFSYGCIHCYRAKNEIRKLEESLPADAVMTYVHASFLPTEGWPMFQRAFLTAEALGIAAGAHDQFFVSIWETGEFPLLDPKGGALRKPLPTIEDAARFYEKYSSVKAAEFLKLANSSQISAAMQGADATVAAYKVPGTPALVVNGRYLIINEELSSWNEIRELVLYLVGTERQRLKLPAPAAKRAP